ncbi:hypothetical protein TNIN_106761 [Trichonephila inaurata madagascariensis]|uniref:Uncharacterized protein n=1 Tax=Trichonephila inaurata madagascariensis TaxID=2747483 RepID=A0A8X7CUQ8_9ARAC|nr:hypothetical protein TNIN_106761 [Trichonephila inaurata madagascariensis]
MLTIGNEGTWEFLMIALQDDDAVRTLVLCLVREGSSQAFFRDAIQRVHVARKIMLLTAYPTLFSNDTRSCDLELLYENNPRVRVSHVVEDVGDSDEVRNDACSTLWTGLHQDDTHGRLRQVTLSGDCSAELRNDAASKNALWPNVGAVRLVGTAQQLPQSAKSSPSALGDTRPGGIEPFYGSTEEGGADGDLRVHVSLLVENVGDIDEMRNVACPKLSAGLCEDGTHSSFRKVFKSHTVEGDCSASGRDNQNSEKSLRPKAAASKSIS